MINLHCIYYRFKTVNELPNALLDV